MKLGLFINAQYLPGESMPQKIQESVEQVRSAGRAGYGRRWTEEEVEHRGTFYQLPRVKPSTRPVQKPHPDRVLESCSGPKETHDKLVYTQS